MVWDKQPRFSVARQRSNVTTDKPIKPPGKNWARAFEKRHPELKARRVRSIDWKRHGNNIHVKITHWFQVIGRVVQDPAILPENVYNVDETVKHARLCHGLASGLLYLLESPVRSGGKFFRINRLSGGRISAQREDNLHGFRAFVFFLLYLRIFIDSNPIGGFEPSCRAVTGSVKVLVGKDDPRDYRGAGVKRTIVTAIECISADGRSFLPLIIWPASTYRSNWTTYKTPGWHCAYSENGYNDFKISLKWLKRVFDP